MEAKILRAFYHTGCRQNNRLTKLGQRMIETKQPCKCQASKMSIRRGNSIQLKIAKMAHKELDCFVCVAVDQAQHSFQDSGWINS
jgi:hypothetical protein